MDRLTFVHDVCHILTNEKSSWKTSNWHQRGLSQTAKLENGYTHIIYASRFITLRRHYTKNGKPPTPLTKTSSWITFDEWMPGIWPLKKDRVSWIPLNNYSYHGIAYIAPNIDITTTWSTHAKRHLKTFQTRECSVHKGTYEDLRADMLRSQVPRYMSASLARTIAHRLTIDPETIDIFIAKNKEGKNIACFVAANDEESKESMYLMGYFLPEAAKLQPMTGLVHHWLTLLNKRGYHAGNFGHMIGPHVSRRDSWWGFSNFKTHFGVTRVHIPSGYWKCFLSLQTRKAQTKSPSQDV